MPSIEEVSRDPYSSYEYIGVSISASESEYLAAIVDPFEAAGDFQRAHDCISEALRRFPREPKLYSRRAYCLVNMKRPKAALVDLDQAIALHPNKATLAEIYKLMGMCHGDLGDDLLGIDHLKKAAALGDAYSIGVLAAMGISS